jgi:ADP-ribosylglycohydrolase
VLAVASLDRALLRTAGPAASEKPPTEGELHDTAEEVRSVYSFDVSCQGSVPESIICFLDSDDFESSVRLAISLGGDADTMACIAGGISEAYYGGVPESIESSVRGFLASDLLEVVDRFRARYCLGAYTGAYICNPAVMSVMIP